MVCKRKSLYFFSFFLNREQPKVFSNVLFVLQISILVNLIFHAQDYWIPLSLIEWFLNFCD